MSGAETKFTPELGDIVQITLPKHHWYPCLVVVDEIKAFGIQGFCFMPTNDGSGTSQAYIRLNYGDFEGVGACVILPESLERERQLARGESPS